MTSRMDGQPSIVGMIRAIYVGPVRPPCPTREHALLERPAHEQMRRRWRRRSFMCFRVAMSSYLNSWESLVLCKYSRIKVMLHVMFHVLTMTHGRPNPRLSLSRVRAPHWVPAATLRRVGRHPFSWHSSVEGFCRWRRLGDCLTATS